MFNSLKYVLMRKLFTLFLALLAGAGTIFAESGTCGENLTWDLTDGVLTISGTGTMNDYSYNSYAPWCSKASSIKSVIIDDGVTSIGNYAFYLCINLSSVTIPNSVTSICSDYVSNYSNITELHYTGSMNDWCTKAWDPSIISFSYDLYIYGNKQTDLVIPNSVTSIGNHAFSGCTSLTSIKIPYVPSIGESAFSRCSSLVSVEIPISVINIGGGAFSGCAGLTSVTIPNSVTNIGEYTFRGCSALTSMEIPNSVKSIGNYAFSECTGLTSIEIPTSVTNIGSRAFEGCCSMLSVEIPNSVTKIGTDAFGLVPNIVYDGTATGAPWGARSMNGFVDGWLVYSDETKTQLLACVAFAEGEINIPNSVISIGAKAFYGCTWLTSITIPNSVTSIGDWAFYECSSLTSIEISNSVTSIGEYTFRGCSTLTSIEIPNSVTSIGEYAFDNVPNIIYSGTATGSPWGAKSINGYVEGYLVFSDKTKTKLLACFASAIGEIIIPNSVISIGNYAFYGCKKVTSIEIPNGVESIEAYTFHGCSSLKSVTIPPSVSSVGEYAFDETCTSLESVNISDLAAWCKINYAGPGYTFYNPLSYAGHLFLNGEEIIELIIPNGVSEISDFAFIGGSAFTSVSIPNSVTSIGEGAFNSCTSLTSIEISNGVTSISGATFAGCTSLTSITIPNSVTSIGEYAFSACISLASITCMATTPPKVGEWIYDHYYKTFDAIDCSKIPLYVPAGSIKAYKAADEWKNFGAILPISAKDTETTEITTTTTENSVDITWPSVNSAAIYELVIKDKNGNIICTLIFDAQGQLTQIAFHAPSRDGAPQRTQTAGFSFTVTGLDSGTGYDLTITSKDAIGQVIEEQTISFTTEANIPTEVENIQGDNARTTKVLFDDKIYILRGNHIYDAQGKMVR